MTSARDPATILFTKAHEDGTSDVHIAVGAPILFRIDGQLIPQTKEKVTSAQAEQFLDAILEDGPRKRLKEEREVDTSFQLPNGVRLRINCCYERGNVSLVGRIIPTEIPDPEKLRLTPIIEKIRLLREGLVLFTGPTGAGKSTSLASIINTINHERAAHIVTMEDPIEFIFPEGKGLIRQRQYGEDFHSFAEALKRVLRQDPNIVMVGEMRDPETISAALTLAETGHLIFATLHTPNAIQTVDRIIDVFPPHQQSQVRSQLSMSLKVIVSQRLVPKEGGGRIAMHEVLFNTPAVANTIRDNRIQELRTVLETNEAIGMMTFPKTAKKMYKEGLISKEFYERVVAE